LKVFSLEREGKAMRKCWIVAALAALSAGAMAQDAKGPAGEQKAAFERRAFPFEAEVAVERLNVRMFPKQDQTSIITSVLSLGEKLTVVGEKEDFFQILPPRGSTAWVFGRNVKKEGDKGVVTANDVPVRLDSRVNADTLATLKEGETLKIVAEHMGWYKVEAPAAVKYFVGKKYVRAGAAVAVPIPFEPGDGRKAPAPAKGDGDVEARREIAKAEALLDEQKKLIDAQRLDEVDFSEVVRSYETALATARGEAARTEAERGLKRYKDLSLLWATFKARKAAAEAELALRRVEVQKKAVEEPKQWAFTGYVDTTGLLFKRPGTHKLMMGGKIVCFLRVKEGEEKMIGRMNDFYQKYVGVNGIVIKNPDGWDGYSVVVVDEIVGLQQP
jgi:uncharacterized protein YgiM (DUF1202 family)